MLPFLVRRAVMALAVVWLAASAAFFALRSAPGDALDATMARAGASEDQIAAQRAALGLDQPLPVQYARYWLDVARGRWGVSLVNGQPVTEVIAQNVRPTLTLALAALGIALALGVSLGVIDGLERPAGLRWAAGGLAALALAAPVYWTATLAIYALTVAVALFPGVGAEGPRAVLLPALVLGFHTAGSIARVTAASVRDAARGDFVRTARAKGLPDRDVVDHILRVGLLPVVSVAALQAGFLLGGTVITEMIFVRRGLGQVLLTAVTNRDYPVVQGLVVLSALVYTALNALADVLYQRLDPRTRREG